MGEGAVSSRALDSAEAERMDAAAALQLLVELFSTVHQRMCKDLPPLI